MISSKTLFLITNIEVASVVVIRFWLKIKILFKRQNKNSIALLFLFLFHVKDQQCNVIAELVDVKHSKTCQI